MSSCRALRSELCLIVAVKLGCCSSHSKIDQTQAYGQSIVLVVLGLWLASRLANLTLKICLEALLEPSYLDRETELDV